MNNKLIDIIASQIESLNDQEIKKLLEKYDNDTLLSTIIFTSKILLERNDNKEATP